MLFLRPSESPYFPGQFALIGGIARRGGRDRGTELIGEAKLLRCSALGVSPNWATGPFAVFPPYPQSKKPTQGLTGRNG